tara:strand:- start:59 stop:1474 length:1416 start_codon:yes stop_codon:yes gene_type:complete
MRITAQGNIGVGTTTPTNLTDQTSLTINGTSVGRLDLQGTGQLYANSTEIVLQGAYGKIAAIDAGTNQYISFRYATAEKARISSSVFSVGEIQEQTAGTDINLTMVSEDAGLAIMCRSATDGHTPYITMMKTPATSGNYTATASGDFLGVINFRGVNTSAVSDVGASITVKQTGTASGTVPADMQFYTTEVERMRITDVGDVGIGHDGNTSYKLIVQNTANQTLQLNNSTNASYTQDQHIWALNRAGSDAFNFFRLQSNGGSDSEYIFNGAGTAVADGAWNGGGADYAEYFEWADGNSSSQDRVGVSVKLDGTKIVASTSSDDASAIIGVISANPSVVGDTAGLKWQSKYERDDYNRYIWEEYTVTEWTVLATETEKEVLHSYQTDKIPSGLTAPDDATVISKDDNNTTLMRKKLNSSFDESVTYVPRSDRKEWDTVGLMGKLRMTKGQKTGANWIKMKDISDTVEEWLVR